MPRRERVHQRLAKNLMQREQREHGLLSGWLMRVHQIQPVIGPSTEDGLCNSTLGLEDRTGRLDKRCLYAR